LSARATALVADQGLGLFCGLNAVPKRSCLSEYSSRITPEKVSKLLAAWHDALAGEAILKGESISLDFHSVPYFGEHPLVESHYLSKRSRRQPSDEAGIIFITLRRRSPALLKEIAELPPSAWRTVTLDVPHRKYKTPRVYEQKACSRQIHLMTAIMLRRTLLSPIC
jgi:hypothetical protein